MLISAGALLAAMIWVRLDSTHQSPAPPPPPEPAEPSEPAQLPARGHPAAGPGQQALPPPTRSASNYGTASTPPAALEPPGPGSGKDGDAETIEHPHPVTAEHEGIFRENAAIAAMNDAVDARDPSSLRVLLRRYQQEFPRDEYHLGAGYAAIADCLEHPGPASRQSAQQYYDRERASNLRRYVRRHCLEAEPPSR